MKVFGIVIGEKGKRADGRKPITNATLSFDLLYQLSYMSVIAAAGVPRNLIFERAAQLPCYVAEYFRRVELIVKRLKYDYAKACQMVGETAKEEEVKTLLLRFSSSLLSGEPESDFLTREAEAHCRVYENEYGRKLETLKLWTDAYVSLNLSAVLIIIMGIISTMIWKVDMTFIAGLTVAAIGAAILGVWLIYIMSPRERMILRWSGSNEQKLTGRLFRFLTPLAVIVSGFLVLKGLNVGIAMMAVAFIIFPIGFEAAKDDKKVNKKDDEIGAFLRSLGGVSTAIGTTVREALNQLDLKAIMNLSRDVKRLYTRLISGISARLCWNRFISDTGSELINRSVGMFYDAIDLGGEPGQAGYHASLFAARIAMLRAKRKTISIPFRWLAIAMHAAVVLLLIFITEAVSTFGSMVAIAQEGMPSVSGAAMSAFGTFNFAGLQVMHNLVLPLVVIFSIANALAAGIADGGSRYKILYNLAITVGVSGVGLIILPRMAGVLFQTIQM
jgi:flagellar protein FlaJ